MSETVTAPHILDGAFERVNRAGEHLEDIRARLEAFRQQNEDAVVTQFSSEPPHNIELVVADSVSIRIPILIGEFCYNLRTALDYLVFELAKLDSRIQQDGTQFPIEYKEKKFRGRRETYLKGVNRRHIAMIERLQPYTGCNWLRALHALSNPDKHRELIRIRLTVTGAAYTPVDAEFDTSPLPIRRTPHPVAGEMNVKLDYTATIRFRDGSLVIESLEEIKSEVANALAAFKAEFK
jgi:hypothetical protein